MVSPFHEYARSQSNVEPAAKSSPFHEYAKNQPPQDERSTWERTKDYFKTDKFGEALAMQRKSGGFSGAPALYPKEAKEVATEVATIGAIEAAFAPVMGWAAATQWAPKTLTALTRLTQAGTTGAGVATTKSLVNEGELPSQEQLIKDGATWVAIDAAMQAMHLTAAGGKKAYDFGKAVNDIAKKDNVPATEVLDKLWDSTKNYLSQKFGRSIKTPADILPADVEVLTENAKRVEAASEKAVESGAPPEAEQAPPSEPEMAPPEPQYAPEEQKIGAPEKFLKSDFEIAQDIQEALSPLNRELESPKTVPPNLIDFVFSPVKGEMESLSPDRVVDPRFIGEESARAVQRVSDNIYKENSRLWNEAEELASEEIFQRGELAEQLRTIAQEAPSRSAGGEAKLQNFAQDLLDKLEKRRGKRVKMMAMSNEQLIKEIKQARVGYDYRYSGGVQGHRINEFINAVEQELIRTSSPESRNALLRAREGSKNWAQRFKDPTVLPFRNKKLSTPRANYSKLTSPDTFHIVSDILEQDNKGKHLVNLAKRNMAEKVLEPYLLKPQSFNPIKFERDMAALNGIIPEETLNAFGEKVYANYVKAMNGPQKAPKGPTFATISEAQVPAKLRTIEGLRQLKKELSQVSGGKEKYDEIAGTMGIDLLFGGQMDVPANSARIKSMINDRNGRPYIKETLGEDNLRVLDDLVKNNELEKRLLEIKENPTLVSILQTPDVIFKGAKALYYMLQGRPITAINQFMSVHKKVSKGLEQGKASTSAAPAEDVELR